ncbi:sigma-70 family RNA polymerase sigma factor [Acidipropionibacterium virtanenii]|uniref:RNA polymerase sigma factor SigA n=1 Tax=Acidipropionibacterium virtanenii TaxID=2057246 RepID=A0A344UR47_9ACTN|nr:sigma-70 family RNA polymerase sigma factor [Acidipropionibacterium virtanenii]AXE37745.1 RNA polymerase sigma factor SigA [Acidipropionibacterium virtanenii]
MRRPALGTIGGLGSHPLNKLPCREPMLPFEAGGVVETGSAETDDAVTDGPGAPEARENTDPPALEELEYEPETEPDGDDQMGYVGGTASRALPVDDDDVDDVDLPELTDDPWTMKPGTRLWAWQRDAVDAWNTGDHVGIVQAVTGTGKTMVGVVAIAQALRTGRRCVVLVPSDHLVKQWVRALRLLLPNAILAEKAEEKPIWDVRVSTVQTAMSHTFLMRREAGMVVADECHRYGAPAYSVALRPGYDWRLGLSATVEREDDGDEILKAYFRRVSFDLGYQRAVEDNLIAPYDIALVGVPLEASENAEYRRLTDEMSAKATQLKDIAGVPSEPVSVFMAQVSELARDHSSMWHGLASAYLARFAGRKDLLAGTRMKQKVLRILAPVVSRSHGSLVFTQTKESARSAAELLGREGISSGAVHSGQGADEREESIFEFAAGVTQALAAPRVLDEGVDVPGADLGVVVASNRSRRQMIQRMGRVLRRKNGDRPARFVVMYAIDTVEDPHHFGEMPAFFKESLPWARQWEEFDLGVAGESVRLLEFLGVTQEQPEWESEREGLIGRGPGIEGGPEPGGPVGTTPVEVTTTRPGTGRNRDTDDQSPQPVGENDEPTVTIAAPATDDAAGWEDADWDDDEELLGGIRISDDIVRDYLRQIGRYRLLRGGKEEAALARRIECGVYASHLLDIGAWDAAATRADLELLAGQGTVAFEQMVTANLRLVVSVVKRTVGTGLEFIDRIQEGNVGLIHAVQKFDYSKGYKFSTYATWWIKQAVTRATAAQGSTIRIPVHFGERINKARNWLRDHDLEWGDCSKSCTDGIPELEISYDELVRMSRMARPLVSIESLYELVSDSVEMTPIHGDGPVVPGLHGDPNTPFVWKAMEILQFEDPREARILMLRWGFETGEPETLDAIGGVFGVTRERIRQLEKLGIERVRDIVRENAAGQIPENRPTSAIPVHDKRQGLHSRIKAHGKSQRRKSAKVGS